MVLSADFGPKKKAFLCKKMPFLPVFGVIFLVDFAKNHIWKPVCGILETPYPDLLVIERIRSINIKLAKLQIQKVGKTPKLAKKWGL